MNPQQRLNDLEMVVSENLQKTDRLIDDMGQVIDLVTRNQADINQIRTTVAKLSTTTDSTARAIAKLTVSTQERFEQVTDDLAQLSAATEGRFEQVDAKLENLRTEVKTDIADLRTEINQRFDQLITIVQERLK